MDQNLPNQEIYSKLEELKIVKEELVLRNRDLIKAKAEHDAILENIGDGVIGVNTKGEVAYVNSQVEKLTGWKKEELLGKYIVHTIRLEDEKGQEIPIEKVPIRLAMFDNRKVVSSEYYYVRKDGSRFAVAITATPVVLFESQQVGGVNVFRDVSKERDVDRMKTEFISLASHQLRTPLSAMKWFSELLLDGTSGELTDEQKEIVENIYNSNERMIELVNSLLNISRIESGRIIIEPVLTDLGNLVKEVIVELKPKIDKKKHNVALSLHGSLPKVNIDPKLVRHVYMNLLTNAVKYTQDGGDIVVIISKSGNEIISQVSDNGYGIPLEQQEKVFSKFFRAENIVKIETDGTGLGLYLTKAIVDSSGGKIWFESQPGKGTTFWFILPLTGSQAHEGEVSIDS
jgi:PAS domain S-box-containing protein